MISFFPPFGHTVTCRFNPACPSCRISTAIKRTPSVRVEHSYDNESNSAKCEMAKEETARIAEQQSSAPG